MTTSRVRRILCATDFSPGAARALHTAVRIARQADAELLIASACYLPPNAFGEESPYASQLEAVMTTETEQQLEVVAREASKLGARAVTTRPLHGPPWKAIVNSLVLEAVDLCVIGTHGQSELARVGIGSVSEQVVRYAPCPVLVVRPDDASKPYRRALVAIDFGDSSRLALERAAELVPDADSAIVLLHVIEVPVLPASSAASELLAFEYVARARKELAALVADVNPRTAAAITLRTVIGRPGTELLLALDEAPGWDLAVLGSHHRTGPAQLVLGSVAEKLVRTARCPILVVHAPAG